MAVILSISRKSVEYGVATLGLVSALYVKIKSFVVRGAPSVHFTRFKKKVIVLPSGDTINRFAISPVSLKLLLYFSRPLKISPAISADAESVANIGFTRFASPIDLCIKVEAKAALTAINKKIAVSKIFLP